MHQSSILIVGAGPTGLSLAVFLERYGLKPRIVDAAEGPARESRALAVHARTLEVLGPDLAQTLVAQGQRIERAELFDGERQIARIVLAGSPTPYPFALGLGQSETERTFVEHLAQRGIEVEWNTRLVALSAGDRPRVTLQGPEQQQVSVEPDWVIGCDGVGSATREQASIEVDSARDARWWFLADGRLQGDALPAHDAIRVFLGKAGVVGLLPLHEPGWWRIVVPGKTTGDRPEVTVDSIEAMVAERSSLSLRFVEHDWLSAFRIREHVAERYRVGRVLIAGDAAHAHSPLGGQGMNTGIQDAANLAWKLALVTEGADVVLLDSYEAERRPVAETLVNATGAGTRAIYATASWLVWLRNTAVEALASLDVVTRRIRQSIEMLDVAYPDSPIVSEHSQATGDSEDPDWSARRAFRKASLAGERAPLEVEGVMALLAEPCHTVLLFDGREATEGGYQRMRDVAEALASSPVWSTIAVVPTSEGAETLSSLCCVVDEDMRLHDAFGAETEGLVVVRPDKYIAFRSHPIDLAALARWWKHITGLGL